MLGPGIGRRGVKKDKAKVVDEVWDAARVRSFLLCQPPPGVDADWHCLLRAYHGMRAEDFELFLGFFTAASRNLDAVDPRGDTLLDRVRRHRNSGAFAQALIAAGASPLARHSP